MNPVLAVIVVLIFLVIVGMGWAIQQNNEAQRRVRLMNVVRGQGRGFDTKGTDPRDDQNKRRAEIAKKLQQSKREDAASAKAKKVTLSVLLAQAGLSISVQQYWIYSFVSAGLMIGLAMMTGQSLFVMIMAGVVGLFGLPRFVLSRMAKRRQKKFLEEFPDALEATVRLLKAGMPVSEAISMISREFTGPVGEEMTRIYDQQKIGTALHEAALMATRRIPLPEMKMFATGLAIQAQTGSSLSEVLQNLAGVIRARFKLKRKIKALSSEAIASASIIGALPNLLAGGMYFANRDYISILFNDPFGNVLLAGAVIWMGIGIVMMKVMINFKI